MQTINDVRRAKEEGTEQSYRLARITDLTELTVKLPDELARQIRAAGLLDEAALEKVFREALRKQAVGELFAALDEIESLKLPPMTEAEVQAEINTTRAERRAHTSK